MALTQADYDSIYETLSNDSSGAVVMYGTVVERREDGTAAVDVGTGTIAAEALSSIDIGGAMGERVVMLVQDNLATIIGVVGDEVTSHIITNLTNDMDATNAAIAGIRTDIETVGEEAQKAFDRADEVGEYADKLAATITDVQTTVTEQGVLIEGATSTANAALEASTELQVDLDGFKTTVSQTYATQVALEQETLDRQSEIAQTVSDITTTVSETYATKSALSDEVAERESSIAQSASEVLTTVSENYVNNETGATYASKTELSQTAEDLTVSISAAASTANSAASGVETLNTMIRMDADGVTVGQSADNGKTYESARTRVGTDGAFTIMDTDGTTLAKYGAAEIELGCNTNTSEISFCNDALMIESITQGSGYYDYNDSIIYSPTNQMYIRSGDDSIMIRNESDNQYNGAQVALMENTLQIGAINTSQGYLGCYQTLNGNGTMTFYCNSIVLTDPSNYNTWNIPIATVAAILSGSNSLSLSTPYAGTIDLDVEHGHALVWTADEYAEQFGAPFDPLTSALCFYNADTDLCKNSVCYGTNAAGDIEALVFGDYNGKYKLGYKISKEATDYAHSANR